MKILLFISLYSAIVYGQHDRVDFTIIEKFINSHFIEQQSIDVINPPSYLHIDRDDYNKLSAEKKQIVANYLVMLLELEHDELKKYSFEYSAVAHNNIDVDLLKDYRLIHEDKSQVYYMVCDNKIVTHFILDGNDKIISFAPNVFSSHGGRIEPFMLDDLNE